MARLSMLIFLLFATAKICLGQNINQNINQNVNQNINQSINQNTNQNSIIINNQPVIEKKEYIVKYRTVYVDKPQPKRYARKLSAPICLLNYLWIYPEDLGSYINGPSEIISQINRQGLHGRNNWRVPTDDELRLMENYADKCGLGDDIYLSTTHRNGILRLVSTGMSVAEQIAEEKEWQKQQERERLQREKEQAALAEARARRQEEEARKRAEAETARRQYEAEAAKREAERRAAARQASIDAQNRLISTGYAFLVDGVLWSSCNMGATGSYGTGVAYQNVSCPYGWRLPTEYEFRAMLKQSTMYGGYFKHSSGLIIPFGTYAIKGSTGAFQLPSMMTVSGGSSKLVRTVQDKLY